MSISKAKLSSIVDDIENKVISDIDRRIATLSNRERQRYEQWQRERREWSKREDAFERYLNGEQPPQLPWWLKDRLLPEAENLDGKSADELAEIYRTMVER